MKLINTKNKCFFVSIILTTNDFIILFFLTTLSLIFQTQKFKREQNIYIKIYNYQTKRIKKDINKKKGTNILFLKTKSLMFSLVLISIPLFLIFYK